MSSPRCILALLLLAAPIAGAQGPFNFPGAEANAPWREKAEDKIDELRKADLLVSVVNEKGEPIKDAAITLKQKRHSFPFTIAVDPTKFGAAAGDDENARTYRDRVAALFDMPRTPPEADESALEQVRQWALGVGLLDPTTAPETQSVDPSLDPGTLRQPANFVAELEGAPDSKLPFRLIDVTLTSDPSSEAALELQAYYLRDFLTAAFADERVAEIDFTQLWDADETPSGWAIYNHDWSPRPVAAMLEQLLRKTWWTEDGGLTSATGEWKTRAFLGDYRITASDGTRTKTVNATLSVPASKVKITLADDPPAPSPSPKEKPE